MRISGRGQIAIPKALRDRAGMNHNVEVEITAVPDGLLIRKRTVGQHPVDAVFGTLRQGGSTDDYLEDIRGR